MGILAIIVLLSVCYLFWHFHKNPIDKWWKLFLAIAAVFAIEGFIFGFMPWHIFLIKAPIIVGFLGFFAGGITVSCFAFLLMKSLIKEDCVTANSCFGGFIFFFAVFMALFCYARAFLPLLAS